MVRCLWALMIGAVFTGAAWAAPAPDEAELGAPPVYLDDPFADDDFVDSTLIQKRAHPAAGRFEAGVLFSTSTIDKYNTHYGANLDLNYHILETVGVGLTFGFYHGAYTSIVSSPTGIIGNKLQQCLRSNRTCNGINPGVPDTRQLTGLLSANFIWAPLYGKISVVSEIDLNLQLYGLIGGGILGRRSVQAVPLPGAATSADFELVGGNFGDGGLFSDPTGHGMVGLGLRVFLLDWLNIRGEFRTLIYADRFDFDQNGTDETYVTAAYMAQVGFGIVPFVAGAE